MMNKYVSKLFGIMFQSPQTQQVVRAPSQHLPASPEEWHVHWQAKGFSWRTEPEIDVKRQDELTKCRAIVPDIEKGIYPFKGMKLSRADIEWLLATHENGRGPIIWSDEEQRYRKGLDLRGADVSYVDLSELPLSCLHAGLTTKEWIHATNEQKEAAATSLESARLKNTHLENAHLNGAYLKHAYFNSVTRQSTEAYLTGAYFWHAHLEGAELPRTHLEKVVFAHAHLEGAVFVAAHLEGASFADAYLEGTIFIVAHLEGASFSKAHLGKKTDLSGAYLEDISLYDTFLGGEERIGPRLADAHWDGVNLTVTKWPQVNRLGDEYETQQKDSDGKVKEKSVQIEEYEGAVRANRQLAVVLQNQGLNEDANRFAYRAQILQRKLLWKQKKFWKWFGSMMLAVLAGYGYRMWHILVAYLFIILVCAGAYFVLGMYNEPHLSFLDALLTSITAFHGRVFSEPFLHTGTPQLWVTAFEAVMGLVIEGVFIAMLTQKFFGK